MNAIHVIAALIAFGAANFTAAEPETRASIEVCKDSVTEPARNPEKLMAAILKAVNHSQASSQENPADDWDKIFEQPNWIHVQFAASKVFPLNTGTATVSEILVLFPTGDAGRRWPDYILLKANTGVLSRAKWTACEMREIVTAASFDPKDEARPFDRYCAGGR